MISPMFLRDTVNQVGKVAPGIINTASLEINNITQQRTNQIISQVWVGEGGWDRKIKKVLPNILRGATEDVYQTTFCLLGKFGRQQLQKLQNKILS